MIHAQITIDNKLVTYLPLVNYLWSVLTTFIVVSLPILAISLLLSPLADAV